MSYATEHMLTPTFTPGLPHAGPIIFFDDFITGTSGATGLYGKFSDTADTGEWLFQAEQGTIVLAPTVQDDADGGWVSMSTDNVDIDDDIAMQLNGESFKLARGRNMYFETRLKVAAVTANGIFGLAIADTSPFATAPASYIAFRLVAGSIQFTCNDGGSAPAFVDSGVDIVADTFVTLAFEFNGATERIKFYVDGTHVGTKTSDQPFDAHLSPIMGIQTTVALTSATLTIDYIKVINDRS